VACCNGGALLAHHQHVLWLHHLLQHPFVLLCYAGTPVGPNTTPLLYSLLGDVAQKVDTTTFGNRTHLVDVVARVRDVLADSIVLDRALPVSVSPGWKDAYVHAFTVTGAEGPVGMGWRPRRFTSGCARSVCNLLTEGSEEGTRAAAHNHAAYSGDQFTLHS